MLSYSKPKQPFAISTINPRPQFLPLEAPPITDVYPSLPGPPRSPVFMPTHTLSTHIIPAAFPQCPSTPGQIEMPATFSTKEERAVWIKKTSVEMVHEKLDLIAGKDVGQVTSSALLWSCINRIARNSPPEAGKTGITLVVTNPLGFHKEIWEESLKHMIKLTEEPTSSIRIDEIWAIEAVCHGDSALINGANIPRIIDRADYGRDVANMCIHYLPTRNYSGNPLSLHLPRLDTKVSSDRIKNGYKDRKLVALGHSLGGDAIALLAIYHPMLLSACILLETTIFPHDPNINIRGYKIVSMTLNRKSSWKSREEARESFLKSPVFKAFDPAVLDAYVNYGLHEDPKTGLVHLKCKPTWEAADFMESRVNSEVYELLPTVDECLELRWIMGGTDDASSLVGGREVTQNVVWRREKNTSNVMIPDANHLVAQEKPYELGKFSN
ncbi:hypothetical protein BDQ12DRAFT_4197 [Crucibulum laeve]|uniref:Uncharacterized protein n=1 Tax=Crucibulum laeve TaxID=68775 RepID=A0A5C3MIE6_9AGAR|nr:hypothetical protein BDQ12DRAFT_4197 [Crucibulum laeve]